MVCVQNFFKVKSKIRILTTYIVKLSYDFFVNLICLQAKKKITKYMAFMFNIAVV